MKRVALLFCMVILIEAAWGQTGKFSLSVAPGVAIPLGKFAARDINDKSAAFANVDAALNINFNYRLTNTFGIAALLGGQQNGVDTKTQASQIAAATPNSEASVKSNPWMMGRVLLGGSLAAPFAKNSKLQFTARLMAGVSKTSSRTMFVTQMFGAPGNLGGGTIAAYSSQSLMSVPWSFAWLAGAGLQYNIHKSVYLLGAIEYNSTAPKAAYPNLANLGGTVITGSNGPVVIPASNNAYVRRQALNSLNISIGIGTKL